MLRMKFYFTLTSHFTSLSVKYRVLPAKIVPFPLNSLKIDVNRLLKPPKMTKTADSEE